MENHSNNHMPHAEIIMLQELYDEKSPYFYKNQSRVRLTGYVFAVDNHRRCCLLVHGSYSVSVDLSVIDLSSVGVDDDILYQFIGDLVITNGSGIKSKVLIDFIIIEVIDWMKLMLCYIDNRSSLKIQRSHSKQELCDNAMDLIIHSMKRLYWNEGSI